MLPFLIGALGFLGKAAAVVQTFGQVVNTVQSVFGGGPQQANAAAPGSSAVANSELSQIPAAIQRAMAASNAALDKRQPSAASTGASESTSVANAAASNTNESASTASSPAPASTGANANPTNARTSMQGDQAVFENDNYIITAGKDNNTVDIYNKKTKEWYAAVGGPDMKIDGQQGFNFLGTTSLMLNDGTKVTLGKADDGKGGSLASKLTITNGAYGAQIIGIDSNKTGDLAVKEFQGQGQELDQAVDDGVVMEENQDININNGRGFAVSDMNGMKNGVTQGYLDTVYKTKPKTETAESLGQFAGGGAQPASETAQPTQSTQPAQPAGEAAQPTPTAQPAQPASQPVNRTPEAAKPSQPADQPNPVPTSPSARRGTPKGRPDNVPYDRCFNQPPWVKPGAGNDRPRSKASGRPYVYTEMSNPRSNRAYVPNAWSGKNSGRTATYYTRTESRNPTPVTKPRYFDPSSGSFNPANRRQLENGRPANQNPPTMPSGIEGSKGVYQDNDRSNAAMRVEMNKPSRSDIAVRIYA